MSGYSRIPQFRSGQQAIRQAFGMLGYGSQYNGIIPDLYSAVADAQDLISPLKTYVEIPCMEYEVCDNRIELPNELALIVCASFNGLPMTWLRTGGCDRVSNNYNQFNRCSANAQGFTIDGCYMKFNPMLSNGSRIKVNGLGRPLDSDGCPMIPECCILAVSEYICKRLCIRYRDNRLGVFESDWLRHCKRARAELNQLSNQDVRNLGYFWYKQPVFASFAPGWVGWGYSGGSLAGGAP